MSPALAGGFLTAAPPGKSQEVNIFEQNLGCLSFDCELYEGGSWDETLSYWMVGRPGGLRAEAAGWYSRHVYQLAWWYFNILTAEVAE